MFELELDVVKQMLLIGVAATAYELNNDALSIFNAVRAYRPDIPQARLGIALVEFGRNDDATAIAMLRETLKEFPDFHTGKSMLALILKTTAQNGWKELAQEVIKDGSDANAVELATTLLGEEIGKVDAPQQQVGFGFARA